MITEIGGGDIPEIIAINKADIASPDVVMELLRKEPHSFAISVKSGFGIEGLVHAIEKSLPHPGVEIDVIIGYERGDLVHAIHESGEILLEEHLAEGTHIKGFVDGALADAMAAELSGAPQSEVRTLLAKFGLGTEHVARSVDTLSPGERTRAALALLQARGVNLLVLDEPTNHLDLPAIEQLEAALEVYDGTLLLVSHDRRLLDTVRVDRWFDVDKGSVVER